MEVALDLCAICRMALAQRFFLEELVDLSSKQFSSEPVSLLIEVTVSKSA
jgi:hypothetical protein